MNLSHYLSRKVQLLSALNISFIVGFSFSFCLSFLLFFIQQSCYDLHINIRFRKQLDVIILLIELIYFNFNFIFASHPFVYLN